MTSDEPGPETNKAYAIGLARAFGGAVIFAIPLLMTMEMWSLGFTMRRGRLLLFLAINFAILVGLSYFAGFEKTFNWKEDAMDAFAVFAYPPFPGGGCPGRSVPGARSRRKCPKPIALFDGLWGPARSASATAVSDTGGSAAGSAA
jgi:Putative integral membrane protein (DUF2391)